MNRKIMWLFLSCLLILALVAWSCDGTTAVDGEQEEEEEEPQSSADTTIDPTETTRQAVQSARRVYLEINQTNQEVEPEFSYYLANYIKFFLTYHGLALAEPGGKYDISITFNLTAEPLGAKYQGADDLCYTGSDIFGEVVVAGTQGEPIQYDFHGHDPVSRGIITECLTKKQAPFYKNYEPETLSILTDLWGVPMCVYAYIWRVEFLSQGYNAEGKPYVEKAWDT